MEKAIRQKKAKKNFPVRKLVTYIMLAFYTLILFVPFLVVVCTSLMSDYEIGANDFHLFPDELSWEGYELIFSFDPNAVNGVPSLLIGFLNTMWQTLVPTVVSLLVSALVAFVYSKFRFPGRKIFFLANVFTMMLPLGAFGFVGYLFYVNIGWVGGARGLLPLIIPALFGSAGTIFFLRTYYDSALSNEIVEAAKIDGAGMVRLFFSVALPLGKPAILAQFLFAFVGGYNSYSAQLMYLYNDKSLWNLQLALSELTGMLSEGNGYNNAKCAAAFISMLPLIILYICMQKYFIEGINIGGGKE